LRVEAEKIAAWREIARRLAHEIKNPLTPIQLTVQQMRDKYTGSDAAYKKLVSDCTEIVTEEVESLRILVQEFAEFARMPSLSLGRQDLNQILQDVTRLYPESKIQLELNPDLPELDLDNEQMRRVLINLVENGLEAAGDSGVISIHSRIQDRTVVLVIGDNGSGVPDTDRDRIFQPYVSSKSSGMGLGLAVVRSIVENHRGTISVADGPDGGAQFEIAFPIPDGSVDKAEVST
jgi:two-component system nitrogen regulation sensor histidine kinase NtrY